MITGEYRPDREAWVIRLYLGRTDDVGSYALEFTPASPGPVASEWSHTSGILGESRGGTLALITDPGWPPDTYTVRIWEQPDPGRDPDFYGVVGLITGGRDPEASRYSVSLLGLGDLDAERGAEGVTGSYGGGYTLYGLSASTVPLPGETIQEFHTRLLEPHPEGTWGVHPSGEGVVGFPIYDSSIVTLPAEQAAGLQLTGYERQEYVTRLVATPGERWAPLVLERGDFTLPDGSRSLVPPKTARVSGAELTETDIERPAPLTRLSVTRWRDGQALLGDETTTGPLGTQVALAYAGRLEGATAPSDGEIPTAQAGFRYVLPLSDLIRGSAGSRFAREATYNLKRLTLPFKAWVNLANPALPLPAAYDEQRRELGSFGVLEWRSYLARTPDETWAGALHRIDRAKPFVLSGEDADRGALVNLTLHEDYREEVFTHLNGGHYFYVLEGEFTLTARLRWGRRRADADQALPEYRRHYGDGTLNLELRPPVMQVDALRTSIPPALIPPGFGAPPASNLTHQGTYPGVLRPPARVSGLPVPGGGLTNSPVVHATVRRTPETLQTDWQAGARQTGRGR